jgi:O-methyltransferase
MRWLQLLRTKLHLRTRLVNSKASLYLEPLGEICLRFAYLIKFARWYDKTGLRQVQACTTRGSVYSERYRLYELVSMKEELAAMPIDYLEFGVYEGASLEWWLANNQNPSSRFFGFDTFTGLPDKWGDLPKGTFSTGGRHPRLRDERCRFVVGLFQDTLQGFLQETNLDRKLVIHLDADLYSSTVFVLLTLAPKLKKGDIIIFDELADVMQEFRAFVDFSLAFPISYNVLGSMNNCGQVALQLL